MNLIYDVFYDNATEPAMRVREVQDDVTGQIVYENYFTGERVFLFSGDTEMRLELVPDASTVESGMDFLAECEASFQSVSEN